MAPLAMAKRMDDLVGLDPHAASESSGVELVGNLYETLIVADASAPGGFAPLLATPKQLGITRWSFALDPSRRFASGQPVTAEDVAFSLQRATAPDLAQHPYRPAAPVLCTLGLQATVQDGAVLVETARPYARGLLLAALASSAAAVVEKRQVVEHGAAWLDGRSAGSGRFALRDPPPKETEPVLRDQHVVLNPNPYNPRPPASRVTILHVPDPAVQFALLRRGAVAVARDLLPDAFDAASRMSGTRVLRRPSAGLVFLAMNVSKDPFKELPAREAVRWGVDYEGLAGTGSFARLAVHQGFLPLDMAGASADRPFRFDPAKARALLGAPPAILIDHAGGALRSTIAVRVADSLEQAGFRVGLRSQSGRELLTRMRVRDFQVALTDWRADTMDPHANAQAFCWNGDDTDASAARTLAWMCHWQDAAATSAVEAAAVEQDAARRAAGYADLQRQLSARGPFAILLQEHVVAAVRAPAKIELGFLSAQTRYAADGGRR